MTTFTSHFKSALLWGAMSMALGAPLFATGAVVPDRTRVIYNEGAQSESVTVSNKSPKYPFLIQSWIEDAQGQKVASPFVVLPPLQRIEPGERNIVRVALLQGTTLPSDRESVFYLNIREIPPKTDAVNALQIALHSRLKLFYRPKNIVPDRDVDTSLPMTVSIDGAAKKLVFKNPTPYYISIVSLTTGEKKAPVKFESVMVSPMSQVDAPFTDAVPTLLNVSHISDYGGETEVPYACEAGTCRSTKK